MVKDQVRVERVSRALQARGWDALLCSLPSNVLLLSGYWPMVGTALAVATADARVGVVAPQDECELVERGWPDEVKLFSSGSLDRVEPLSEAVCPKLAELGAALGLSADSVIGVESAPETQPASYAAMNVYGPELALLVEKAWPQAKFCPAGQVLGDLRSALTPHEANVVGLACHLARDGFEEIRRGLRVGMEEKAVAALGRSKLSSVDCDRADGFMYCMSGPNAARANAAYQLSTARRLQEGDFVLVHCNSYVRGFWTDVTRTFVLGEPSETQRRMYDAVFAARQAALDAIRPHVSAASVDHAARRVLEERGYGKQFPHATGHGVGFAAIDHRSRPRIHPQSPDILEVGSTFNIEPAIYCEGFGGLRHCDVVTITKNSPHVLTPFLNSPDELWIQTISDVAVTGRNRETP